MMKCFCIPTMAVFMAKRVQSTAVLFRLIKTPRKISLGGREGESTARITKSAGPCIHHPLLCKEQVTEEAQHWPIKELRTVLLLGQSLVFS